MAQVTEEEISAEIQETVMRAYLKYMKSDQLEEETSVSKSFLLIFDYFIYFNKNIELNLPKRKKDSER